MFSCIQSYYPCWGVCYILSLTCKLLNASKPSSQLNYPTIPVADLNIQLKLSFQTHHHHQHHHRFQYAFSTQHFMPHEQTSNKYRKHAVIVLTHKRLIHPWKNIFSFLSGNTACDDNLCEGRDKVKEDGGWREIKWQSLENSRAHYRSSKSI